MKELFDDNVDNQERRKVFADADHTGAASVRNVTSTGVSPGRSKEEKLGSNATVISSCPSGLGCSELFSHFFWSAFKT